MMTISVTGADKVQQSILELARRIPQKVAGALMVEAELTMREAKDLCPVVNGTLKSSGHVTLPVIAGGEISVQMGFGGPTGIGNLGESNDEPVYYAKLVHENPRAGHTYGFSPSGRKYQDKKGKKGRRRFSTVGQWKFLEQPFLARATGFDLRLRSRILGDW